MNFPHFFQLEEKDCGPTCLKIIAKSYGKLYSTSELKEFCKVTRSGVSLQDIISGATQIGFESLPIKATLPKIQELPLPAILFWRQDHYVVLYKIKKNRKGRKYYISDPSFGKLGLNEEVFSKNWLGNEYNGIILLLEPQEKFYENNPLPTKKFRSIIELFRLFVNIIKSNKTKSSIAFILICIAMISTWFFPAIFKKIIDEGVLAKNVNIVFSLLIVQFIIFCSQIISDSISGLLLMQVNFKVSIQFLVSYLHKLIRLPLKIFDTKLNSDLILRMDDSDRIQSFLTHHSLEFILSFINLTIFSVMLFYYNIFTFYIFLGMTALSIIWTVLFLKRRKMLDYSRFSVSSENRNNLYELINNMPEIKINNAHNNKISQWEAIQMKLNKINLKALYLNYYQLIGSNFFSRSKDIFITALCAYWVIYNKMTLGVMMTIGFILGQLNSPINSLISIIQGSQDAKLSFDRLEDIQKIKDENENLEESLLESPKCQISFDNVSFKYEGTFSPYVLQNINFSIPIGKTTAIVGTSGSGKTTLMKLLLAIYNPNKGDVKLDKINLKKIIPDSWRIKCGIVLQDGYIFSGTYAENIALGENSIDLERIKRAAKLACIDEFIDSLPLGYHTMIGKAGVGLSGGQQQRILIARAIYRDPEFIFFDEATSSLDANNERQIMENLQEIFKFKTVVIIAHRLSTVKYADQIIVIEKGKIIECGKHDKLVFNKGQYYELVKNQLELGD